VSAAVATSKIRGAKSRQIPAGKVKPLRTNPRNRHRTGRDPLLRLSLDDDELIVDNFAGGGGASEAMAEALGRKIDIAINHDAEAIAMHRVNHPETLHLCESVWDVDIEKVVAGRRIGLAWFSPDCTHFSKAKGAKPVKREIRGLAWIALRWARKVRPRVIMLENVEEFQTWGPVIHVKKRGKPLYEDGKPVLIPNKRKAGMTFKRWCSNLRSLGYELEVGQLRACKYGAPTLRNRLFVVARCDGQPITWPEETHGEAPNLFRQLQPYRTAAECIEWSLPCPSIFLSADEAKSLGIKRPLAEATMRRIARGVMRYVINNPRPFIVNLTHQGADRNESIDEPFKTITGARRGEKALVMPVLVQSGYGEREGQKPRSLDLQRPLGTVVAGGVKHAIASAVLVGAGGPEYGGKPKAIDAPYKTQTAENHSALVTAFLGQYNSDKNASNSAGRCHEVTEPVNTVPTENRHSLVTSHIVKLKGTCRDGQRTDTPLATVCGGGTHLAEVRAFLLKYFGTDQDPRLEQPMHTVTSKHRFGLIYVFGEPYQIVDIGMRMLTPRELFRAQGFPHDYVIEYGLDEDGTQRPLTKASQVRMCGNSVSPPPAAALVRANFATETFAEGVA
jgi:DNA (cytosine-5)-methyltransferase 1